jgi:type II secretory pathway component GspD/PulD (secretin)
MHPGVPTSRAGITRWARCIGFVLAVFLVYGTMVFAESPAVWVDPSTGRITVRSTREQIRNVEETISGFPTQARQIEIQAKIVEVSTNDTDKFGAYFQYLTGQEVPIGLLGEGSNLELGPKTLQDLDAGNGQMFFDFYSVTEQSQFETILNMLVTEGRAELLSQPRVVTLSGQVAGVYVTTEVPYLSSVTYETINDVQVPVENYEYATVGIVLQVLPRIVGDDLIELSIVPLVGNYEVLAEFGAQHPIFKRQVSPTNVTVKDQESLIIGGLITKEETQQTIGFPIVSQLPIVGSLFRSTVNSVDERNLLIQIKPRIIKPREIEGRTKRVFQLKYALAEDVAQQLRSVLSPEGSLEVNPVEAPPNSIVVRDWEDKIVLMESILDHMGTFSAQARQKTYQLKSTPVNAAAATVKGLLSDRGFVVADEETETLWVEDGIYQLSIVDSAIAVLEDYNAAIQQRLLSFEYVNPPEVVDKISAFLSPQGYVEVISEDTLLVEDNRMAIEKIEQLVRSLDVPAR